jgi:peptide deformylase
MAKKLKYMNGALVEYEILPLVDYYDDILREPTIPYDFNSRKDSEYIAYSLAESMSHYGGLGLSANQVGLRDRVCAINMGKEAWIMFNPVIVEKSTTKADYSEGCLSYPGLYLKIGRSDHVKVRFQAIGGQFLEKEMDGLTAVCVQHEIDHLDGIRYTDLVSPIKLDQAKRKVKTTLKKMARVALSQEIS